MRAIGVFLAAALFVGAGIGGLYLLGARGSCSGALDCALLLVRPEQRFLVGEWTRYYLDDFGGQAAHIMRFSIQDGRHRYDSFLGGREEFADCAWSLAQHVVTIACPQDNLEASFTIESAGPDALVISFDGIEQRYSRPAQ